MFRKFGSVITDGDVVVMQKINSDKRSAAVRSLGAKYVFHAANRVQRGSGQGVDVTDIAMLRNQAH